MRAIHLHDASVDVVALDQVWHAREVVVAAAAERVRDPRLHATAAGRHCGGGSSLRSRHRGEVSAALRPTPFWLDNGRNGIGQFLGPPGLYFADASLPDVATLVGFVGGTTAVEWTRHSAAQRRDAIIHHASVMFGDDALQPVGLVERVWAPDEWGGGGYSNVLTTHAPRRGRHAWLSGCHWSRSPAPSSPPVSPGYVEGAIVAGRAAAAQVALRLSHA